MHPPTARTSSSPRSSGRAHSFPGRSLRANHRRGLALVAVLTITLVLLIVVMTTTLIAATTHDESHRSPRTNQSLLLAESALDTLPVLGRHAAHPLPHHAGASLRLHDTLQRWLELNDLATADVPGLGETTLAAVASDGDRVTLRSTGRADGSSATRSLLVDARLVRAPTPERLDAAVVSRGPIHAGANARIEGGPTHRHPAIPTDRPHDDLPDALFRHAFGVALSDVIEGADVYRPDDVTHLSLDDVVVLLSEPGPPARICGRGLVLVMRDAGGWHNDGCPEPFRGVVYTARPLEADNVITIEGALVLDTPGDPAFVGTGTATHSIRYDPAAVREALDLPAAPAQAHIEIMRGTVRSR